LNLERYIGKKDEFSFEHRMLNIVLVFAIIIAFATIGFNYLLDMGVLITGISVISGIVLGILYYISIIKKMYRTSVGFLTFIFIFMITPAMWISNGGILGGTTFYIIMFSSAIAVVLRGFPRIIAFGCLVIITFSLIIIEYRNPSLIVGYDSAFDRYVDTSFGLLIALITVTFLFIVIINQYIKEHRRANQYLAEIKKQKIDLLNQQFVRVFNACPALMAIYREKDFVYIAANDAWFNCLGFQRNDVIGHSEEELNTLGLAEQRKSIGGFDLEKPEECQVRTKQGEIREWLVSKARLQLDGDECILLASIDITISKHLEKEIARLDRLNLIGEMAAGVAHEIRNPMTVVKGYLQFLSSKASDSMIEQFGIALDELETVEQIITDFLSLARNKLSEPKSQNLNAIINGVIPLIHTDAIKRGIDLNVNLAKEMPNLLLNEKEIKQLLLNLARNGMEAMNQDGALTIETSVNSDSVCLCVVDCGCGVCKEYREKIFDPFFTTKDNGTGLGLSVCAGIVRRHNGSIEVESEEGKGTRFIVTFRPL